MSITVDNEKPLDGSTGHGDDVPSATTRGWRFWAVFSAICFTTMLAAIESTVTSTALPFIVHELDAGELYVWFVNAYFLTRYLLLSPPF